MALRKYQSITTEVVIQLLEEIMEMYGKPREILTDNGSVYGENREGDNEFDRWCLKKGIRHIRTGVHRPTTIGKVERLFLTVDCEISYCNNDLEYFRFRYNHVRPHRSLFGRTPADVYWSEEQLFFCKILFLYF